LISVRRSRETRLRSSASGLGGTTIEQTRGSPRLNAISVRRSASPSIASVLARRCRRGTAMEAASTTWLSIPFACSVRWIQKPSKPASWTVTIATGEPTRRSALARNRDSRPSSAAASPPRTECFDILPPPGSRTVTSHRDRLSSRDANIEAGAGWEVVGRGAFPVLSIVRPAECLVRRAQSGGSGRRSPP